MNATPLHFLLVPDAAAARRLRRELAARGNGFGVVVGVWSELLGWARRAYLLPSAEGQETALAEGLRAVDDAFWAESLEVAPAETAEAVSSALARLLGASDPQAGIQPDSWQGLPDSLCLRLQDLARLSRHLHGRLPDELAVMHAMLTARGEAPLYPIRVHRLQDLPELDRWQGLWVDRLNRDAERAGAPDDEDWSTLMADVLQGQASAPHGSALHALQTRLFDDSAASQRPDSSVQWVGVRDFLQEAEVAAGMVQSLLPRYRPAQIGLLIPDGFAYAAALADAFGRAGLALSGLPVDGGLRNLGREAVLHFLHCRQKPAPVMALASCLTSPLMPWTRQDGAQLAQRLMAGDYRLRASPELGKDGAAMLDLLRQGDGQPATLRAALSAFHALLRGDEDLAEHRRRAGQVIEQLCRSLTGAPALDWSALRRLATPQSLGAEHAPDFNLEGVTVWRETREPWRPVRRLIVLGFAEGHYPMKPAADPVFSADDLACLGARAGLSLSAPSSQLQAQRHRFRRQLCAVAEAVTFLIPRRDLQGKRQGVSDSMVFMHQLLSGAREAEDRVLELDAAEQWPGIAHLALAEPSSPVSPRRLLANDLAWERDLLTLNRKVGGGLPAESPSSLETLMVSGLAWLLHRLDAEPLSWAPESANAALLGSLAHRVFEGLFQPGRPLPADDEIPGRVDALLARAIEQMAPFLDLPHWQLERRHFAAETARGACVWRDMLTRLDARILASEAWLQGSWAGVPIHGRSDLLLGLPDGRSLVVDYKRSQSKDRRSRMTKGYDSQASLYRTMLATGAYRHGAGVGTTAAIEPESEIGVIYYFLKDQVALSDWTFQASAGIPGWHGLDQDVSSQAMAMLRRRLAELRGGRLLLNRSNDPQVLEKQAGIKPYALDNSPLIKLFSLPAEEVVS